MALSVSRLVRVAINLSPIAAARRSFGILMIAGDSTVINGLERFRSYDTIEGVALDFGINAPEYKAAALYFGQTPKPKTLMIGRWIRTASPGLNIGGLLTASQQAISNWTSISNGTFVITVDGVSHNVSGLDFTLQTNLNGVASVISAALTGSTCTWDGSKFTITATSTGAGAKASGTITLNTNPVNGDTLTVDGTLITFVSAGPIGSQVLIGSTVTDTSNNLQTFLSSSVDANISLATYVTVSLVTTVTYKVTGTAGNAFTLAKVSAHITLSAATLSGGTTTSTIGYATTLGSGTDISAQLKLTATTNIVLVNGYDAETPAQCAAILANDSSRWYGLMFQASVEPTILQSLAVSDFIEALDIKRIYGVTITDPSVLSALVSNDLASLQKAVGYLRSFCQYSQNAYAIASFFGRAFSVNFSANRSVITLMYKQEPGVTGEDLDTTQADTLQAKRCNVFVDYVNDTVIIQYGVMSGPAYFDEVHGLDWLQDAVQNACYNLLYQSPTKIPQTDAGTNQFVNAIGGVFDEGVNNGLIAPGVWNADGFGELTFGQFLKTGYYIFAEPIALQSQSEREQRVAPPIQSAVKLAGAIQELDVLINVNR